MPRAKIVPCFPSATLKSDEQQSTVAERPLLPLFSNQTSGMESTPFRCSVPHSPSIGFLTCLTRLAGGGCRRCDCEVTGPQAYNIQTKRIDG